MASCDKRKNGTYRIRVYCGTQNNRQKSVSATYKPTKGMTQKQIEQNLIWFTKEFEDMVRSGSYDSGTGCRSLDCSKMTIKNFVDDYYYTEAKSSQSPNTFRLYHSIIEQLIIPSFGNVSLSDIERGHLQDFVNYLATKPEARIDKKGGLLSTETVRRYARVFCSVMRCAYSMEFINDYPFKEGSIKYPQNYPGFDRKALDAENYGCAELQVFISALSKENIFTRALLLTAISTGVRRGELAALKWYDIDLNLKYLIVEKSAYKVKGEKQDLKGPKSKNGCRLIRFGDSLATELLSWKEEQDRQRKAAGTKWNEQGFVFTNNCGDMICLYSITRICSVFEANNGIRHLKLHGLRHTFCSLMNSFGTSPETLKKLMGHGDIKTTDIYTHMLHEDEIKAADNMDSFIKMMKEEANYDKAFNNKRDFA